MANTHELSTQSEGSDQGSYCDDFEGDPDYEETESKFSSLSLSLPRNKSKSSDVVVTNPEETEINDENFERVQSLIKVGMVERLKVEECKLYLRKNCLRLSGNKDVLIQRIKEHLEIINGGGERKYPPSSFVLDCKGDACTGDVVLFEQNVYEMFNIASRSASGPSCGKRIVAGRIVKESYGTAKQQHTFTIEVLWSKGEKPFPPLHPLLIKGRNLYRLKTLRQKWEDEGERQKILREKHSRGSIARADREARVQEKQEKVNRKTIMENRVSRKCSVINHPEETDTSIDEKPLFPSALTTKIRNKMSVNKPPGVTEPWGKSDSSRRSNETTAFVDQQDWKHSSHHISEAQLGDFHSREREKYQYQYQYQPHNSERNRFGVKHINNQQDWKHLSHHISEAQLGDFHSKEREQYQYHPLNSERNSFAHRKPLTSANHSPPLPNNREMYKQKQLCRYYARGRCYFGDNCKFVHDSRGV